MERHETQRADGVVAKFLRASGLETPYLQYKLVQAWSTVVDETTARATQALEVREQSLWVRVEIPALRTQLTMMRANSCSASMLQWEVFLFTTLNLSSTTIRFPFYIC